MLPLVLQRIGRSPLYTILNNKIISFPLRKISQAYLMFGLPFCIRASGYNSCHLGLLDIGRRLLRKIDWRGINLNIPTIQVVYYKFLHQQLQRDAKLHEWMEFWGRRHQQWKGHPPTRKTSYGHCGPALSLDHLLLFLQMLPWRNV